ncbi:MAG: hypothetical protein A3E36_00050 [Candidatus Andersenbacteria bacterium RIFCSPHIGHO2_12_FULL_45_11b]|uniref:Uncharacterized protein n=1 Tax=Candidatus Andersenbacteria bacterium RIFCSPHIGHO2_12_FULL_45_11b TaxID=1797282 RepID=A0A1G1X6S2_9BACT|nr:MAG: hypothetical protein A3E36_00050 [Candidatus Andersenbacteria bacterium RIFCSPHIGHO2_12_FULL_45_11b]
MKTHSFFNKVAVTTAVILLVVVTIRPNAVVAAYIDCTSTSFDLFNKTYTSCNTTGLSTPTYNSYSDYSYYLRQNQYREEARNNLLKLELEALANKLRAEQKQDNDVLKLRIDTLTQDVKILFARVFGRQPTVGESNYWVLRGYKETLSNLSLEDKMRYYLSLGKSTPSTSTSRVTAILAEFGTGNTTRIAPSVLSDEIANLAVPAVVEQEFRAVYGKKPNIGESDYWKQRARSDKKNLPALRDAMKYWLAQGFSPVLEKGYIYAPLVK